MPATTEPEPEQERRVEIAPDDGEWQDVTPLIRTKPKRPALLRDLCPFCGADWPLHPEYAAWSCQHGTWNLADDFDNE